MIKTGKNVCLAVAVAAVCCLLLSGGAFLTSKSSVVATLATILMLGGTAGCGWVCWSFYRVVREVDVVTGLLCKGNAVAVKSSQGQVIRRLVKAIEDNQQNRSGVAGELESEVKDLQLQLRLLERQKYNTEAIIYSIRDAVVVVDQYDKLLMANEAAGAILGFDFRRSLNKAFGELVDEEKASFVDLLRECMRSKAQAKKKEIEFAGEEEVRTYDCIVSCVHDETNAVCGVVAVLHDITREKEVSQMKNDFVSHVSHELKTPLASITAYSEMLVDGEADDEQTRQEFYSIIQNQANRLNRLIEDILNISRIESGLVKVKKENASMAILIEEQMQMIKSFAEEKDIKVIGKKPICFDQVYVDKDMVSQVIVNLLSNAVKYTNPSGEVRIESEVDEAEHLVRVCVTDTGVGIPPDEVDHVFDKFYRVSVNSKVAKGTGLGLNLVKQIVEKVHHGRVFVTSEVGRGSTFGFELPLAVKELVESR